MAVQLLALVFAVATLSRTVYADGGVDATCTEDSESSMLQISGWDVDCETITDLATCVGKDAPDGCMMFTSMENSQYHEACHSATSHGSVNNTMDHFCEHTPLLTCETALAVIKYAG
eukprot:TRINITY_DN41985_c0_g1_i1.p1 TRINITY_DN41985_c0_g1~~TRINITY_DN41985_c0_g1_i1.p1  ORF type:complete len:117 (-),score=15.62 TRINITY_DN41985_c0_g1_i1:176-526(-)